MRNLCRALGALLTVPVLVVGTTAAASAIQPATTSSASAAAVAAASGVGDAGRFDTWTGYDVGRFATDVVARDLNGDGLADAVWLRDEFFAPTLSVQLNLGDGTLGQVATYPVTEQPNDIDSGDLDNDGDVDAVVVSDGNSLANTTVDVYLNDGAGGFVRQTATGGIGAESVALADLDGDGDLDAAIGSDGWDSAAETSTDVLSILPGNGNGTFGPQVKIAVGKGVHGVDAADLDGDGDADLAVTRSWYEDPNAELLVLRNGGGLTFTAQPAVNLGYLGQPIVAAGMLDADSLPELVVAGAGERHLVYANGGGLSFAETTYTGGFTSEDLLLADADGDGDTDVVSATQGSSGRGDVTIFPNTGSGTLGASQGLSSGNQPHGVAAGDFTGDGFLDLAVANRGSGTGVVHPQRAGEFVQPPAYDAGGSPNAVVPTDIDGDGDQDVVTATGDYLQADAVEVLVNDGAGQLSVGSTLAAGGRYPVEVTAADLNDDGANDLVWLTAQTPPASFHVALNNGTGTFGTPTSYSVTTYQGAQLELADADGDGDRDVLVTAEYDYPVFLFANDGSGVFGAPTSIMTGWGPEDVKAGDIDGDGITDLVTVHNSGNGPEVQLLRGLGGGAFAPGVGTTTGAREAELVLVDINGDSALDAVALSYDDTFQVLLNNGAGGFAAPVHYSGEVISGYKNGSGIAIGDLNSDGTADVAIANVTGNDVSINWGVGDGSFDTRQVRYGMNFGPRDVAIADLNGDTVLDLVGPNSLGGSSGGAALQSLSSIRSTATRSTMTHSVRLAAAATSTPSGGVSVMLNRSSGSPPPPPASYTLTVTKAGTGSGTVTSNPAGISCGADCTEAYTNGTSVTLQAAAGSGSTFAGWSGACSGTASTCTVPMSTARSVTATFNTSPPPPSTYTLTVTKAGTGSGTVSSLPAGINCGADCSQAYTSGTSVTLKAKPASGSTFGGWSGACSGTSLTCTVTMSAAKTVTATFTSSTPPWRPSACTSRAAGWSW